MIATYLLSVGIIIGVFTYFDKILSDPGKQEIVTRLLRDRHVAPSTLPDAIVLRFDRVFKVRTKQIFGIILHFPSPIRSIVASSIFGAILFALWTNTLPEVIGPTFQYPSNVAPDWSRASYAFVVTTLPYSEEVLCHYWWIEFDTLIVFFILINFPLDYLSLCETRWALSKINANNSLSVIQWLTVDLVLTYGLVFLAYTPVALLSFVFDVAATGLPDFDTLVWYANRSWPEGLLFFTQAADHRITFSSILIYSTFMTSLSIVLLVVAYGIVRIATFLPTAQRTLQRYSLLQSRPMTILGGVAVLAFSLVFWAAIPIFQISDTEISMHRYHLTTSQMEIIERRIHLAMTGRPSPPQFRVVDSESSPGRANPRRAPLVTPTKIEIIGGDITEPLHLQVGDRVQVIEPNFFRFRIANPSRAIRRYAALGAAFTLVVERHGEVRCHVYVPHRVRESTSTV